MIYKLLSLPRSLGGYFLQSTLYASVTLSHRSVRVAVVKVRGHKRTIENCFEERIEERIDNQDTSALLEAVRSAFAKIPTNAHVRIILPSSLVVFKELVVPDMSLAKIKTIVPFEIENSLPFLRSDAYIDSIIIGRIPEKREVRVLAMAIKRESVEFYRTLLKEFSASIEVFSTEVASLYGLLTNVVTKPLAERSFIVAVDDDTACVLFNDKHGYSLLRVLPLHPEAQGAHVGYDRLAHMIIQTIQPTIDRIDDGSHAPHFIICCTGADLPEICEALTTTAHSTCELLPTSKLLHTGTITSAVPLSNRCMLPVAGALPLPTLDDFNLDQDVQHQLQRAAASRQLLIASILCATIFATYLTTRIIAIRHMYNKIYAAEQAALDTLKKQQLFGKINPAKGLSAANKDAEMILRKESAIWNSLAGSQRSAIITVLAELSKVINRDALGLKLNEVAISTAGNKVMLSGSVKDYQALTDLEKALQKSAMFSRVPNLQETQFSASFLFDVTQEGAQ